MNPRVKNLIGRKFGNLKVIEYVRRERGHVFLHCQCDCGGMTTVRASDLKRGHTQSCGCLEKEAKTIHNGRWTRLYGIWCGMKRRCNNPKCESYKYYGERGITVCDEWKNDFAAFRDWAMANGYDDTLTIDRIDNDGDYCPENCQFITKSENSAKQWIDKAAA